MTLPVDLLFSQPQLTSSPVDLVFGETTSSVAIDVHIVGVLPALLGHVRVGPVHKLQVAGVLPALTAQISARYISGAQRPTVGQRSTLWQIAAPSEFGVAARNQGADPVPVGAGTSWQPAADLRTSVEVAFQGGDARVRPSATTSFQKSARLTAAETTTLHQDAERTRRSLTTMFQKGARLPARRAELHHQDGLRDRRNWTAARWQEGDAHYLHLRDIFGDGKQLLFGRESRYQEAMRPPAGTSPIGPVVPPGVVPCYTAPDGDAVHLLFVAPGTDSTDLVFVCETHGPGPGPDPVASVVVPIKRVYVVLNESSLRRVDGNVLLPTFNMSMSLDVDSWTWTFNAALPGRALADLQPDAPGEPVLVEATINGVAYRMQVEQRGRDRSFANDGLKISGRGVSALLDSPHSPIMNYTNSEARTAQQLMNDVLTDNGVSIGWDIDYQAVDWPIPAGVFAHQGPYISALNAIASAAGAYIQPHRTQHLLHVLPRYPELPWDWDSIEPDYEIPSAVATVENISWVDKAVYNRVYVSGVQSGVLGQVTRAGTAGDLVAPMVTDALITTAEAARQRGIPVLANTGSQANVTLRMPVLQETGIIVPGKFIRYVDGGVSRIGITRSVSVDVQSPETWQTIALETHV